MKAIWRHLYRNSRVGLRADSKPTDSLTRAADAASNWRRGNYVYMLTIPGISGTYARMAARDRRARS